MKKLTYDGVQAALIIHGWTKVTFVHVLERNYQLFSFDQGRRHWYAEVYQDGQARLSDSYGSPMRTMQWGEFIQYILTEGLY